MSKNNHELEISQDEFEEVIQNPVTVIDFFAEWCLSPKTKLILNPCTKNIEEAEKGSKLLSFDENFKESFTTVKSSHRILSNKKIKIVTERGREIICTPEHLILTDKRFCRADNLSSGQLVSIYPFSYPFINNDRRIFLTEEKVKEVANKFGLDKQKYIDELKEKNLLKIKYNEEKAYVLASLLGFLLTDGSLSMAKNNERLVEFFVQAERDEKELIDDLKSLGFNASSRQQKIIGKIADRKFTQKITRIRVTKTSLFLLFSALGAIEGKKFIKGLKIPEWITKGPKEIQRAFLQGFLGGDGPKANIFIIERNKGFFNKQHINPIEFHFYSKAENSAKEFANELCSLLNNFNVKIRKIEIEKEDRYERKDKKTSMLLKIHLKSDLESVYNYSSIGFKYSYRKKMISCLVREYLMERIAKIKKRKKMKSQAEKMKRKFTINEIAKKLNLSYSVINNWLSGKKVFPPHDSIRYDEWLKLYSKNNIIFDKIRDVEKYTGKNYPFISLSLNNNTKMFVANDVIHHNCMPCLILAPIIEELSEKFEGKIKFAKINVDENEEISKRFEVSSIPTLIVFKKGKEVERITGSLPQEVLEEKFEGFL